MGINEKLRKTGKKTYLPLQLNVLIRMGTTRPPWT